MSEFSVVEQSMKAAAVRQMTHLPIDLVPEDNDPDPYGYATELEQQLGIDLLPAKWKSPPDDRRYNKRLVARARRSEVAKLVTSGMRRADIALKLGVAEITIERDMTAIQKEWRETYLSTAEDIAARNINRLESYLVNLQNGILRGDTKSVNAAVEIVKELNNIVGVRQGVSVDITQYISEVAEANGYDPVEAVKIAQRISINMR